MKGGIVTDDDDDDDDDIVTVHHQSPDQSHLNVCVVVEVVAEGVVVPHLNHAHLTYTIIKLKTTIDNMLKDILHSSVLAI